MDNAAALPTAPTFAHKLHSLPPPALKSLKTETAGFYRGDKYSDAGGYWLGVKPSYSRPRVSDDNAFVESLFRTAKYRPEFPERGFADLQAARNWASQFVRWYNHEHRHSGIRYVTPAQRHAGLDKDILQARHEVYIQARQRNPQRWSRSTRNWSHIDQVTLNPERQEVPKAAQQSSDKQPMAA